MYFFFTSVSHSLSNACVVFSAADIIQNILNFFSILFLSVRYKISLGGTFTPYIDTILDRLGHQFIFKDIHHYLQLDQTKDFDLYLNILPCPCLPCLVRRSAADSAHLEEGLFSLGGRKFPPNITEMATWILSKSHKTCPAEEMSSTPNLLPGELLLSLGQNSFQSVNKKSDLLILASSYKQMSSSEQWCRFQEEAGHSLHAWDSLCLAALLPTEQSP